MPSIKIARTISTIYENFFRRDPAMVSESNFDSNLGYSITRALAVIFTVRITINGPYDEEFEESRTETIFVHIALSASGYVHVWSYAGSEWDPFKVPLEEWKNPSNHDSCWRSDGVDTTLFQTRINLKKELAKNWGAQKEELSEYITLGDLGAPCNVVNITYKPGKDGRYLLQSIKSSTTHRIGFVKK